MKRGPDRVRGGPFESSKNFSETQFFFTDSRTQARSEITACANQRDAACWRLRDQPNAGVDGDPAENVRVRSIILHHIGNCGSRYSVVTESLTPENWLIRQAVPRTLRRDFSVPAFHTTDDSMERRTRPVGSALTVRAGRISRTIRSSFFKSDSSAFWRRLEGTKALATTYRGENHVSGTLYCLQSLRPANAEVDPPRRRLASPTQSWVDRESLAAQIPE